MRHLCAVIATTLLAGPAFADTINVPGDHSSIQDAIYASVNGDTIAIAAGTYYEHSLNTGGKAITIQGTVNGDGTLATSIDAQQGGGVFVINSGEGDETVIKDLVINGGSITWGGGIFCYNSSPTIKGCTISDNTANNGGGIYCNSNSCPTIIGCTITSNEAGNFGGGIYCTVSSPTITNCTITSNEASEGGGIYSNSYSAFCFFNIRHSTISGNSCDYYGGGIHLDDIPMIDILDCTIEDNVASWAGGIYCGDTSLTISGCTISGNAASASGGLLSEGNSNTTIFGSSVCANIPDQTYEGGSSSITSDFSWIAEICDGSPFISIAVQQDQIDQLLTMHAEQQSAIEELQAIVIACCAEKSCAGDENQDGKVDILDLLLLLNYWGPCP